MGCVRPRDERKGKIDRRVDVSVVGIFHELGDSDILIISKCMESFWKFVTLLSHKLQDSGGLNLEGYAVSFNCRFLWREMHFSGCQEARHSLS